MITFPNAKINLGLNITQKRPDGYHNLETIFYPIPLEDALEITVANGAKNKYNLYSSGIMVEGSPEENLVVKAYLMLDRYFDLPPINIHLYKHIPSGAGLGGGSADAAFMLKLLNNTFNLSISTEELEMYAAQLGADCAFFIQNKPTFAGGIGNVFSPVSLSLKGYRLIVIKPNVFVSTKTAFSKIIPQQPEYSLKEIIARPISEWKGLMVNDFEKSVFPQYPIIQETKEMLYQHGAIYAALSGSGSSVFGVFDGKATILPINKIKDCFHFECFL